MKAVIVGCGRVGSSLARSLADEGWEVVVVERREEALSAPRRRLASPRSPLVISASTIQLIGSGRTAAARRAMSSVP